MDLKKWEWAWIAGLFEGEGCIAFTNDTEKYTGRSVQVKIAMCDRDVIETLERLVPTPGGIRVARFAEKQDQYVWKLSSKDVIEEFFRGVGPYLHSRRSKRIAEALDRLALNRGAKSKRTHCPKGHPLSGDNLYVTRGTGSRSCWTCRRERDKRRDAEARAATAKRRRLREAQQLAAVLADPVII